MQLTSQLAKEISQQTSAISGYAIFIVDTKGLIIGASDPDRVGDFHEASILVLNKKRQLNFTSEQAQGLKGVRAGVVLPIFFNHNIIGVVGITGNPDEVGRFGQLVRNQVEMMCQQGFANEIVKLKERAKETLVHEIISGEVDETLITKSAMLGFDLKVPRVAVILDLSHYRSAASDIIKKMNKPEEGEIYVQFLKDTILKLCESMKTDTEDIIVQTTLSKIIILTTINSDNQLIDEILKLKERINKLLHVIKNKFKLDLCVGIGSYHNELFNIRSSYIEAEQALRLGKKLSDSSCSQSIYFIDDLGLTSLLTQINPAVSQKFIEKKLNNLLKDKNFSTLKETLTTFCDNNLNITETSKALFLHRNTLLYRLSKIEKLTGLDPKNFRDSMQLYTSFQMKTFIE